MNEKVNIAAGAMNAQLPPATVREAMGSAINIGQMFQTLAAFEGAQRMATALSHSTMLPDAYNKNPANCLILLGIANRFEPMGIDLIMVAQNLVPVKGKYSWQGQFVIAVINASRKYLRPLQFEWKRDANGNALECTAFTYQANSKGEEEKVSGVKVTWTMAEGEGWTKNTKWTTIRDLMFTYRAASYFSRVNCPELLMGMPVADEVEDTMVDVTPLHSASQSQDTTDNRNPDTDAPDVKAAEAAVAAEPTLFKQ